VLTLPKRNAHGHAGQTRPLLGATADVRSSGWPAIFDADTDQHSEKTATKYSWARNNADRHTVINLLNTYPSVYVGCHVA